MLDRTKTSEMFVVTFPLKTEKWQEDRINKILNLLSSLYNQKQKKILAKFIHLTHSSEFKVIKDLGLKEQREFWTNNGFSKFDIEKVFADSSKNKSLTSQTLLAHGLNSDIIQDLSHRAWRAWDNKLYGNGQFINLNNKVNVFTSRRHGNVVTGFDYSFTNFTITFKATRPSKHIIFTLPFIVNKASEYESFALGCDVCNIAIVRKEIRQRFKYYVQFSFSGVPYNKGRELGCGIVGVDPGPSNITYVSDNEVKKVLLAENIERDEKRTRLLLRKMARSRRAVNPQKYNENGTINRENKNPFKNSISYEKTRKKLKDTYRKLAARRKISHNILANELLTKGNEFHVENNSFRSMQERVKETTRKTKDKIHFGKSIGNRAPSEFLLILKNKLQRYTDGVYVEIPATTACTQFDFTNSDFSKHKLRERRITLSDNRSHDRDAIAAFNMKFVKKNAVEGKKKMNKDVRNFDVDAMYAFYEKFCEMEKEIQTPNIGNCNPN